MILIKSRTLILLKAGYSNYGWEMFRIRNGELLIDIFHFIYNIMTFVRYKKIRVSLRI